MARDFIYLLAYEIIINIVGQAVDDINLINVTACNTSRRQSPGMPYASAREVYAPFLRPAKPVILLRIKDPPKVPFVLWD